MSSNPNPIPVLAHVLVVMVKEGSIPEKQPFVIKKLPNISQPPPTICLDDDDVTVEYEHVEEADEMTVTKV